MMGGFTGSQYEEALNIKRFLEKANISFASLFDDSLYNSSTILDPKLHDIWIKNSAMSGDMNKFISTIEIPDKGFDRDMVRNSLVNVQDELEDLVLILDRLRTHYSRNDKPIPYELHSIIGGLSEIGSKLYELVTGVDDE